MIVVFPGSRVKTACGFPPWWRRGSSSSPSSCCATFSRGIPSPSSFPTTPGTSSSWSSSPSPTGTWPACACASAPSECAATPSFALPSSRSAPPHCHLCLQEGAATRGGDGGGHHGLLLVAGFGAGCFGLIRIPGFDLNCIKQASFFRSVSRYHAGTVEHRAAPVASFHHLHTHTHTQRSRKGRGWNVTLMYVCLL